MQTLTIGSRRSQLAQIQSRLVQAMLMKAWPDLTVDIVLFDTKGDLNRQAPLPEIGGKGLFTAELEAALRERRIDLAVHSLKDLPVEDSPGLTVIAIPERAKPGDMLISHKANQLAALPTEGVVGTSSLRRAAQILAKRPDLIIKDIRGNVDTRLNKIEDPSLGYDATILAQAGLERMGHAELPQAHIIPFEIMLPAPGQGALGIQSRHDDPEIDHLLAPLDDAHTRAAVEAERAFLAGLGGGCSLPVGAFGQIAQNQLTLQALVAQPDGQKTIRVEGQADITEAKALGKTLAEQALSQGAAGLLVDVN